MFHPKLHVFTPLAVLALVAFACSDAGAPTIPAQLGFNVASHSAPKVPAGVSASIGGDHGTDDGPGQR